MKSYQPLSSEKSCNVLLRFSLLSFPPSIVNLILHRESHISHIIHYYYTIILCHLPCEGRGGSFTLQRKNNLQECSFFFLAQSASVHPVCRWGFYISYHLVTLLYQLVNNYGPELKNYYAQGYRLAVNLHRRTCNLFFLILFSSSTIILFNNKDMSFSWYAKQDIKLH